MANGFGPNEISLSKSSLSRCVDQSRAEGTKERRGRRNEKKTRVEDEGIRMVDEGTKKWKNEEDGGRKERRMEDEGRKEGRKGVEDGGKEEEGGRKERRMGEEQDGAGRKEWWLTGGRDMPSGSNEGRKDGV
jgi:hypothetical protein